jgi:diguanylate cyclase
VAERVRQAIVAQPVVLSTGTLFVTMTFGVAEHIAGCGVDTCITRADHALYAGKHAGKNRVVAAPGNQAAV